MAKKQTNQAPESETDILFIRNRFSKLFAELMNLAEIITPIDKQYTYGNTKGLIGGFITQAEHDILIRVQDKIE